MLPTSYLTFDGLLQPIGAANVLAYIESLASTEDPMDLISLERAADLDSGEHVAALQRSLAARGVRWIRLRYSSGGPVAMLANLLRAFAALGRSTPAAGPRLIHARSYPPAAVAWALTRLRAGSYIFDMRGCWIEEKRAMGKWFTHPWAYALAKRLERRLVRDAAAVVTLTRLQADDLQPLRSTGGPITVVPTCTDYAFWRQRVGSAVPADVKAQLASKLVIAYVGSHTNSYLLEASLRLFAAVRGNRPDAHLLCLSREPGPILQLAQKLGIPTEACTSANVEYGEMPQWLALVNWGLILLAGSPAKRGSFPTKLAEFFAAGVRPIWYGCNAEVEDLVRTAGSGVILEGLSDEDLRAAAIKIATMPRDPEACDRARERTRPLLDLCAGVAVYQALYARLARAQPAAASVSA